MSAVTYTIAFPPDGTRTGSLSAALAYATEARDAAGWVTTITDAEGAVVPYAFSSSGMARAVPPKACDDCGESPARWRAARYWAFCEGCCAARGI